MKNVIMIKSLYLLLFFSLFAFSSCRNTQEKKSTMDTNLTLANKFIDSFYSFDRQRLEDVLSEAKDSWPEIIFYQKWAECGNYKIVKKGKAVSGDETTVLYPITVKDDLMAALEISFNVTDTFHITIENHKIKAVTATSDDPAKYWEAKEWIKENRPDLYDIPCKDAWEGGLTPCECVKATVEGLKEFKKATK